MNSDQNELFLTRKKIIFFVISSIITIIAIALTITEVVKANFSFIFGKIGSAFSSSRYVWFFLLFLCPLVAAVYKFVVYWHWFHKYKTKMKWYSWVFFSIFSRFLGMSTPLGLGIQPFQYFWMRQNKLTHVEAVGIMTCCSFLEMFVGAVITWPSFFYIVAVDRNIILATSGGTYCFTFVVIGMFIDMLLTIIYFGMGYSRHFHIFVATSINKVLKLLKLHYKTRDQIHYEYKQNAVIKKQFINELKDIKDAFIVVVAVTVLTVIEYFSVYFAFQLLGDEHLDKVTFMMYFNSINVAVTANNFVPIPGGEGTVQLVLKIFLQSFVQLKYGKGALENPGIESVIDNGILVWRFFNNYIILFIGFVIAPIALTIYIKKQKAKINSDDAVMLK